MTILRLVKEILDEYGLATESQRRRHRSWQHIRACCVGGTRTRGGPIDTGKSALKGSRWQLIRGAGRLWRVVIVIRLQLARQRGRFCDYGPAELKRGANYSVITRLKPFAKPLHPKRTA